MRALVFDGELSVQDVPMPRRKPGEALIRVLSAGICNTDLELIKGYMGFKGTLGHEFVGVVEETSDIDLLGKRVVGEISCVCHQCRYCQLEMPHHCLERSVLGILNRNGAFAEFLTLPEENLHTVPMAMEDDVAVFTEPTAAAFRILEQIEIDKNTRAIVLGDGKLGQLIAQVLSKKTANLVCAGKHPWKLQMLADLGITTATNDDPLERGSDVVVEVTGSYEGFTRALELVRPEGTIALKTTVAHPTALDLSQPVINEIQIIGSRCGPFRPALNALHEGRVIVTPMVSESYPLEDATRAFARAAANDVMKVILHM